MKKLLAILLSSFLLIAICYLMIAWKAKEIVMYVGILNVLLQPILIGYSIHYFCKIQSSYDGWFILFITINMVLFLLPIILCVLLSLGGPLQF